MSKRVGQVLARVSLPRPRGAGFIRGPQSSWSSLRTGERRLGCIYGEKWRRMSILATAEWLAYPRWLNAGDNAWQMTAATFVGLMSLPGLAVLYGGVMQKRWSVNSMMLTFVAFCLVLVAWCLWAFKMGFGSPIGHRERLPGHVLGQVGNRPLDRRRGGAGDHPVDHDRAGLPFPRGLAGLLPVRVRGDHADPDARLGARADQLQGVDPVRAAVDHVRVHGQRVPDLGRRLLRGPRRAGLLRGLRHPPGRGHLRLRGGRGDRTAIAARPRDRRAQQPVDGRRGRRTAVARLERVQRRGLLLRGRQRLRGRASTRTCAPPWRCSCGSRGTTSSATSPR